MIRITLSLVFGLTMCNCILGQQLPMFTQTQDHISLLNPAAINNDFLLYEQNMSASASYHRQWLGFENAPQTQTLRFDYINQNAGGNFKLLTGGHIINDQTGPTGTTGIYGKIGAVMSEDPTYGGFAAALSVGISQYRVDGSKFRARDLNDVLAVGSQSKVMPDVGLGVSYFKKMSGGGFFDDDWFNAGLSVPQVLGINVAYKTDNGQYSIKRTQHIYAHGSWIHYTDSDRESFLQPSVIVRYAPNAPLNTDFNLRYQFNPAFYLGTGAATSGMYHAEMGVNLGENVGLLGALRIGYAFEYALSNFAAYTGSGHEINFVYSFGNDK